MLFIVLSSYFVRSETWRSARFIAHTKGMTKMTGEKLERLKNLAAQIVAEHDPKKFNALTVELSNLLEEKESWLQKRSAAPTTPTKTQ